MKLWVDDIRKAPDDTWTVAETVTEAINFLSIFGAKTTHISLDHDISFQVEVNGLSRPYPSPETFQAVARFIAVYVAFGYKDTGLVLPTITVHSANPDGAKEIQSILKQAGIDAEYTPCPPCNRLENK